MKYGQIGVVGTLEEYRNKGFAKSVVSELCRCIIAKGKLPTLMVRENNLPAVKVYQKLGFEKYDDYLMVWY